VTAFLLTLLGFLVGSIPFSVWMPRIALRAEVRRFGDGNPGAINAWRAGGWQTGLPVLLLDVGKGVLTVALARFVFHLTGWPLLPVAVAPILGHVFSPFLRFRGGKGIATTFGVWTALTLWLVPTTLGLLMAALMTIQSVPGWTVLLAMLGTLGVLLGLRVEGVLIAAFALNLLIIGWTHRRDLASGPRWRTRAKRQEIR
jgi:acyl phosphate:glycerol-3-phosphate acyltransferase